MRLSYGIEQPKRLGLLYAVAMFSACLIKFNLNLLLFPHVAQQPN